MRQPHDLLKVDMAVRDPKIFEKRKSGLINAQLPGDPVQSTACACQVCDSVGQLVSSSPWVPPAAVP